MAASAIEAVRGFMLGRDGEPVDEIGLAHRAHYVLISAIAFFVGLLTIVVSFTAVGSQLANPLGYAVSLGGMAVPFVFWWIARRTHFALSKPAISAVLMLAVLGPFVCHFGAPAVSMDYLAMYMLGPIGIAFYGTFRQTVAMIVLSVTLMMIVAVQSNEPQALMHGAIVSMITVATSLMLWAIKRHLARTVRSNREIADRDPLTGAFNMQRFDERIEDEIAQAQAGFGSFALIVVDLDEFALVNERAGHAAGDAVLIAAAEAVQSALAPVDLLVRRNADEFVVIAPELPDRDPRTVALQARDRVAAARRALQPDLPATACAGWARYERGDSAVTLIERAEAAVDDAKRAATYASAGERPPRAAPAPRAEPVAPASPDTAVQELRRRRAEERALSDDPMRGTLSIAMATAMWATVAISTLLFVFVLLGKAGFTFTPFAIAMFAAWAFVLAPFFFAAPRALPPVVADHAMAGLTLLLISLTCVAVGDAAPAVAELLMMGALFYMILLPLKWALVYATPAFAIYAVLLLGQGLPGAGVRVAVTFVTFGFLCAILQLTRDRALQAAGEKAALARADDLTGLANDRRLRNWLETEVARCAQTEDSLALLLLDVDELKRVNQHAGRAAGDDVLRAVASALRASARERDLAARVGSDEFALALTDANRTDAAAMTGRLRDAVFEACRTAAPDDPPAATVGWVVWRLGESADDLVLRGEDALHEAKLRSRDPRAKPSSEAA